MSDIRNWPNFIRGRWSWAATGYETRLHRGCGFTDVDAMTERNGYHLVIEAKHCERPDLTFTIPTGQRSALLSLTNLLHPLTGEPAITVYVLAGDAQDNDPMGLLVFHGGRLVTRREWGNREEGRLGLADAIDQWAKHVEGRR